jgi:CRISPR-associated protein Cas6
VSEAVDVVFALQGGPVALDYADLLWRAVRAPLPWLADEESAGIHPLAGVSGGDKEIYLTQRARLTLRLPRQRLAAAEALSGSRLDLGGPVVVGAATVKPLSQITTLYSPFVTVGTADELAFLTACQAALAADSIAARLVCGKAHRGQGGGTEWQGFSLMLFALSIENSLRVQQQGLGSERKRGCGIFVPHKAVNAVGE